ncbi:hypothetical protein OHS59_22740 [Streptomyces sp. NBC_00414]|uniref:hypothetical protein n=1 Tax=Streptomyces sp. NBC_00414 TaxID=2975739 RepID=UPI002E241A4E
MATAVALLTAACSGGQPSRPQDRSPEEERAGDTARVATSFAHAPESYPLDVYRTTAGEQADVDRAISVLARACMKKFGETRPAYEAPRGYFPLNARKYGPTDLESVRVYGYKPPLPDGITRQEVVSAQRRALAAERAITPASEVVYTGVAQAAGKSGGTAVEVPPGVPKGGCHGLAQSEVRADEAGADLLVIQKLFFRASGTTRKDPGTVALDKKWSVCMRGAGMNYSNPLAAVDDSTWQTQKTSVNGPHPNFPAPSAKEIEVAEADVRCKGRTGYVTGRYAIEARHQQKLIEENRSVLDAVMKRKQRMIERAVSIVPDAPKKQ